MTDNLVVNAIRVLSAEGVEAAKSGHPGLPLGAAPIAYSLFQNCLRFNPKDTSWPDRDRFVLSAGHGSMLMYSLLHLYGYGLEIDDLKNFRRYGSKTPGHPEYKHTIGVETTTGPLGQGVSNAVGMAMAERHLAARFNEDGFPVVDHYTYALVGDGCMMEGIASEACSLAGTLGLGRLIVLYDSNNITIEGDTDIAFREDVGARYAAYGWHVTEVKDGTDTSAITKAIEAAKADDRPSLIVVKTVIGYGSPKAGSASVHGEPLGADNLAALKQGFNWEGDFVVPQSVYDAIEPIKARGARAQEQWNALMEGYKAAFSDKHAQLISFLSGKMPDLTDDAAFFKYEGKAATRNSSGEALNRLAALLPNLIGGSADLAPSNKTNLKGLGDFSAEDYAGRNIHFGVREHAMAAIANGMALHGGLRVFCATFFVFSDYLKHSIRLSCLMNLPVMYVLTHDSIGVGEDGPTHQPVEQLAMLRSIPGMTTFRPADSHEVAAAYAFALGHEGPVALALTRQDLPLYESSGKAAMRGGYVLSPASKATPDMILIASGSEVELAMGAQAALKDKGVDASVVSMPSFELFDRQDAAYRESVLPCAVRRRVGIEAASSFGWHKYVGLDGALVTMDTFGASGNASVLFKEFGFTVDNVVQKAMGLMG